MLLFALSRRLLSREALRSWGDVYHDQPDMNEDYMIGTHNVCCRTEVGISIM